MAALKKDTKEIDMRSHGHATVWGTHVGVGPARDSTGWCQRLKEWWASHKAARREARLAVLNTCWDPARETVRPLRADAAPDMAVMQGALSMATLLYGLTR